MHNRRAQLLNAAERSRQIRRRRVEVREQLTAGRLTLAAALLVPEVQRVQVIEVVLALPHWGPRRAETVLRGAGIFGRRTVGQLTQRQRDVLVDLVDQAHERGLSRLELVA